MSVPADIADSSDNITVKVEGKTCFICGLAGDPINNKLKNLSSIILNKSINAIEVRKISQSDRSRKYLDVSLIQLPEDLEEKGYHQQCYKQLTNLSGKRKFKKYDTVSQSNEDSHESTREHCEGNDRSPSKPTAKGCVFCTQVLKKQCDKLVLCNFAKEDNNYESFQIVIDNATQLFELSIIERIDTYQEQNLPIPYHQSCKTEFLNKCRQKKENTEWHQRREKYERARKQLYVFIEEYVVEKMHIFQFSFITNLFRQFLLKEYNSDQLPQCFDTGNLQSQIENKFKGKVKIIYNQNRKHIVSSSATLENVNMRWVNDINTIHTSAPILRQ